MSDNVKEVFLHESEIGKCSFPHATPEPATYDGKTVMGPWAKMCDQHFKTYGVGLGTGRGQRLLKKE